MIITSPNQRIEFHKNKTHLSHTSHTSHTLNSLSNAPHPLPNNGTSQQQRSLTAQLPGYVLIDERSESDLLEYVFQLARTVVYQEVEAEVLQKSDWQDFFRLSVPIQLALISKFDMAALRADFDQALLNFESGLGRGELGPLLSEVFDLARLINRWQANFSDGTSIKTDINNLITNDLRFSFSQLVGVANEAEHKLGASEYRRPQNLQPFLNNPVWQFSAGDLLTTGMPVSSTSAQAKGTVSDKKTFYAKRAKDLFQVFLQGVERIVKSAQNPDTQKKSIEAFANHQPHIGLLLAFTRMFKLLQADLNGLGEKHLDFYLRKVLCLNPKPAEPDHAHLVVELDKQVPKYKLIQGKAFKAAAKDSKGQEIDFALDAETILNQAQVLELRTLYRDKGSDPKKGTPAITGGALKRIRVAAKANSFDGKGLPFEDPTAATWETLGSARAKKPETLHDTGRVGFIIASPTLLLNEGDGNVRITITFGGSSNLPDIPISLFRISYSGKKGWVSANASATPNAHVLTIEFNIAAGGEPLTFADPLALKADFGTTNPIVLVELNPETPADWAAYDEIFPRKIDNINLNVVANRVRNLVLSNDEGALDPNKPFMPFGAVPHIGSDFIVGCEEAFRKKLKDITLNATWDKLPAKSFHDYYQWYAPLPENDSFKADLSFLKDGKWVKGNSVSGMTLPFQLFKTQDNNVLAKDAPDAYFIINQQQLNVNDLSHLNETLAPYSNASNSGFVKLSLTGSDFRHQEYPSVLAGRLAEIAGGGFSPATLAYINGELTTAQTNLDEAAPRLVTADSSLTDFPAFPPFVLTSDANARIDSADTEVGSTKSDVHDADDAITNVQKALAKVKATDLPNPPYTPTIKEFYISYTAESEWSPTSVGDMTFAHVYPYEAQNHEKQAKIGEFGLLPTFEDEGTLYIGLKNLIPGASLNLLFQMAEATANPDVQTYSAANIPDVPDWKYLKDNSWETLRPKFEVRHDATKGLIASGIVELTIPFEISNKNTTILPNNLHWLKVSFREGTAGVSETVAVHAQAVKTTFDIKLDKDKNPINDTARLANPLPLGSISKPVEDDASLKKINQPYESFGGRPAENDPTFRRRAGEHLRHKGRSIALYDYERMILEHFPEIFKVKCLTHTHVFKNATGKVRDFYIAPGHVSLAVIPDITRFGFAEKLRPCASRALLLEIEDFVKKHTTPFVKVHVVNPVFQDVDITGSVVLKADKDPAFYQEEMAKDILRFLTPWAFGAKDQLAFGGKLYKSSVLNFIETLDYVDYVVKFTLNSPALGQSDGNVILTQTERSIIAAGKIIIETNGSCPDPLSNQTDLKGLGHDMINTLKITG